MIWGLRFNYMALYLTIVNNQTIDKSLIEFGVRAKGQKNKASH